MALYRSLTLSLAIVALAIFVSATNLFAQETVQTEEELIAELQKVVVEKANATITQNVIASKVPVDRIALEHAKDDLKSAEAKEMLIIMKLEKLRGDSGAKGSSETSPDSSETLEERLNRLKEYRKATPSRMERLTTEATIDRFESGADDELRADAQDLEADWADERAEKKVRKYDTRAMREIRKERDREAKAERDRDKDQFEAKRNTGLYCPNRADYDKVWIHPSMKRVYSNLTHVRTTIHNNLSEPVSIRRISGQDSVSQLIENMCPGGTVTLYERPFGGFTWGSQYLRVQYGATSKMSGERFISQEMTVNGWQTMSMVFDIGRQ